MTRRKDGLSAARRFGKPAEDVEDVRLRSSALRLCILPHLI